MLFCFCLSILCSQFLLIKLELFFGEYLAGFLCFVVDADSLKVFYGKFVGKNVRDDI